MVGKLVRGLRMLWAERELADSASEGFLHGLVLEEVEFAELHETVARNGPQRAPYELLADVWLDAVWAATPNYPGFLPSLGRRYSTPLDSVLDLGCGAGRMVSALAERHERVVGLDASQAMLARARRLCEDSPRVRLVAGDFRRFDLADTFDAVVCAADTLNELESCAQLAEVMGCVMRHLRPGGFFLCDALNHRTFMGLSGRYMHYRVGERVWVVAHDYDLEHHTGRAMAIFEEGIETHRRIPIEPEQFHDAARSAGLVVVNHFGDDCHGLLRAHLGRQFYIVRRPG